MSKDLTYLEAIREALVEEMRRDPIPTFTTYLTTRHVLDDAKRKEIEDKVKATIDEAVEFAMNAPDPTPDQATTDLYA